ncbi:MAG: diguanylate cyclase [Treponema sp.]|jgi:diguanylate cyclase (GGDEF)-like protein|nr:diguanylate cyclase [Treponema sp.]
MDALKVLTHVRRLLRDNVIPPLDGELAEDQTLREIHEDIKGIREAVLSFSAGDFSPAIKVRGIIPGCLKALQAHLRHLIWQVQLVEKGDFSQEVRFMGEFSTAFNNMTRQLNHTLSMLKQKEESLTALADNLRNEVDHRETVVEALQESEARFKYLASHDALTGALNRGSFFERAAADLRHAFDRNIPCCMAILDIDHFKNFNDTYGHGAGDETLRHVVRILAEGLRKTDFMGRYGGEEFVIFFYNADEGTGMMIAERLRASLEAHEVPLENVSVSVHASFGVVQTKQGDDPSDGDYVQRLVNDADVAMYAAKRAGRNRVMFYKPEQCVQYVRRSAEGETAEEMTESALEESAAEKTAAP